MDHAIDALDTVELESVEQMQDGVLYKNGYRIDSEKSINDVAEQWDERRKVMCVAEVSTLESLPKSTVSNGNGIHIERTKNYATENGESSFNVDDEPNEQNNYRPILRDDRTERRKAFNKKRHSSSSSDSIRLSREEELKMFTSLEEEEYKNSSFTPITYSNGSSTNSHKNIDSSFHEKQKYDAEAWGNKKPSNYHDSELWKRERATSIVEEKEDNSSITNRKTLNSSSKRPGSNGTADKPTRKTSCENDQYASNRDACELLHKVYNDDGLCTLNSIDEKIAEENRDDACDIQTTTQPHQMIKKIDNLPNLHEYFNDALTTDVQHRIDPMTPTSPILIGKPPRNISVAEMDTLRSRDARSTTVYSRSDSESSNIIYTKSISMDSSSTYNESIADSGYLRKGYNRTDSSNSFIQDELDSEEYHHSHRFSMTADTLEYIRGRDDWRIYTENKLNNRYRRLSSNISIREEIDSDEYHHDRKLSDLVEIAYLDAESIKSLPSSFEGSKVFDRYYLELQHIKGQLSNDIERNVAQKQVILLDSNEIEPAEGYMYPLPDIVLDQVSVHGDDTYTVEQLDSDYSNVSESEDDAQSVIEVNHGSPYEGEIITTFDMDGDDDEMIEVTLWELNDNATREFSSKESSVEIISIPVENLIGDADPSSDDTLNEITNNVHSSETSDLLVKSDLGIEERESKGDIQTTTNAGENIKIETTEDSSKSDVNNLKTKNNLELQDQTKTSQTNRKELEERQIKSASPLQTLKTEDKLMRTAQESNNHPRSSTGTEASKSFIEHENLSSAHKSGLSSNHTNNDPVHPSAKTNKSKKTNDIDDLIMEGCMGVWFHN